MLLELNISDFAIIERLRLQLGEGFNTLTGETGAGKSIIIDALGTLRGDRTDPTFVRAGAERARVEGVFSIDSRPDLVPLLQEYGLWEEQDEQIILTREINGESGRSVARVNGRAVNSNVLREVGGRLIDIHGQHEGLAIFNVKTHLDTLDRYAGLLPLRNEVAAQVEELRRVREALADLRTAAARRAERIEELRFLIEDITAAKLKPDEEEELTRERSVVQNGARIAELIGGAYDALYGSEVGTRRSKPVVEALDAIHIALGELAKIDQSAEKLAEQAGEVRFATEDLLANVRAYRDSFDFDTGRLDAIEDRLTLLRDLQRKHRGTLADLIIRAAAAEGEIERLTNSDEHMAVLEQQVAKLRAAVGARASELSKQRRAAGTRIANEVVNATRELAMPHVRFEVSITQRIVDDGVPVAADLVTLDGKQAVNGKQPTVAYDKTGIDQVEFLLAPNPGEPLKPLAKIASGGESARILLALKSILSRVDEVPTLIFDEVDVGIGGRAGQVVGEKLWGISARHQVICITHLPQVAAFGDAHYGIAKQVQENRTRTAVTRLSDDQRVDELALMLDGTPSEHSRSSAREMIERARGYKHKAIREQIGRDRAVPHTDTLADPAHA